MKLDGKDQEWKFLASSDQLLVQLTWIKDKEPDTSSRKLKSALQKKNQPPSTRRCNVKRFAQWMDTKSAIVPADSQEQKPKAIVAYNSQTETRDTIVGKQLTPTNYKAEPVDVVINTDIVTSPFNPKKACHRLISYTSATDFDERSDIEDPDLLITPSHTSPLNLASKEAI